MRHWLAGSLVSLFAVAGCGDDSSASGGAGGEGGAGGAPVEEQIVPAPGGLRKLTSRQYVASIRVIFGDAAAAAATPPTDQASFGLEAIAASDLALSAAQVETYEQSALRVADAVVADPAAKAAAVPCTPVSTADEACFTTIAERAGRLAFRRPVTDQELGELVAAGVAGANAYDSFDAGVASLLALVLQSPDFLYQVELGEPDPDNGSRRRLLPWELASRLSFFLLGQTPDEELLDLAEAGELSSEVQLRELAMQLVTKPRAKEALSDFYSEVFELRNTSAIQKDPALFPLFTDLTRAAIAEETKLFLEELVWTQDTNALSMYDAPFTFVNEDNAWIYGLSVTGKAFQKVNVSGRSGVLTQPSFLAGHAHPGETSPTRRGKFLLQSMLCQTIPPPPPGVIPTLPPVEGGHKTMRQRLSEVISEDSCKTCHNRMDPPGLALEHFDSVGAYRETDLGLPLDVSGESVGLGAYDGAPELGTSVRAYEGAAGCMVRQLYRQSMGHLEYKGEEPAIEAITAAFGEQDNRVQALLVEIAVSPAFRLVGEPK